MSKTKVYVGNLPPDIRPRDIEDLFFKYGKIVDIDLKNKRGPPFAFVEFEDDRDAKDAVRSRDGYNYDGYALRVEFPRGVSYPNGSGSFGRGNGGTGGRGGYGDGGGSGSTNSKNRGPPSSRSEYRVFVSGLPPTGSWQDLKDHMREAGDVGYADVHKDGTGVVEYLRYEDMKYALKKLDDSKFRSHEGETSYVRVRKDSSGSVGYAAATAHGSSSRGRSRTRSRSVSPHKRSRSSPTYSPMPRSRTRSHSRSRSRSRSPRH